MSETIAEHIRSRIATGQLKPGDILPSERVLLEVYDVARPTMRGALRILESDGLVSIERGHKGGARVVEPDISPLARRVGLHLQLRGTDVLELIEAQAMIQPGAAALAASARDASDLARLRAAVNRFTASNTVGDFLGAVEAFTDALLHASHNRAIALYSELTGALLSEGLRSYAIENQISVKLIKDVIKWTAIQFGTLVDLIEACDADGADEFWRDYLRVTGTALLTSPSPLKLYASRTARGATPNKPPQGQPGSMGASAGMKRSRKWPSTRQK